MLGLSIILVIYIPTITMFAVVPTGVNSPDRRLTDNGYFCNQYGYIAYDDYGVQYSYGHLIDRLFQNSIFLWLRSPDTYDYISNAYYVWSDGDLANVYNGGPGIGHSYGRIRASTSVCGS